MKSNPAEYIEKANLLPRDELEKIFARMPSELQSKMGSKKVSTLEVAAIQLATEADQVIERRTKWTRSPACVEMAENISS